MKSLIKLPNTDTWVDPQAVQAVFLTEVQTAYSCRYVTRVILASGDKIDVPRDVATVAAVLATLTTAYRQETSS